MKRADKKQRRPRGQWSVYIRLFAATFGGLILLLCSAFFTQVAIRGAAAGEREELFLQPAKAVQNIEKAPQAENPTSLVAAVHPSSPEEKSAADLVESMVREGQGKGAEYDSLPAAEPEQPASPAPKAPESALSEGAAAKPVSGERPAGVESKVKKIRPFNTVVLFRKPIKGLVPQWERVVRESIRKKDFSAAIQASVCLPMSTNAGWPCVAV